MSLHSSDWLALTTWSESKRPEEWPYIMQVILNRLESKSYPYTMFEVCLQPYQFSAFNDLESHRSDEAAVWQEARQAQRFWGDLADAVKFQAEAMLAGKSPNKFKGLAMDPERVLNYWSPISMVPTWRWPTWDWNKLRVFGVPGIDPRRFMFAEEVTWPHAIA